MVALLVALAAPGAQAQRAVTATGITEPVADATLSSASIGIIHAWKFKEGERVPAGEAIIELDKHLEELDVERRKLIWENQSELKLAETQVTIRKLLAESKAEVKLAEAQVEIRKLIADSKVELRLAEAQVATLKVDVEATRKLFKTSKSVSQEQLDKKELEFKQAIAEHDKVLVTEESERLQHKQASADLEKAVVAKAKEQLEYQQAVTDLEKIQAAEVREKLEYDLAVEALRRRHVYAPFAGIIVEHFKKVGEACQANERLVRLVDTSRCYFVSNMDAKAGSRLKLGQSLKLEIESGDTFVAVTGTVHFISPVVDSASGLLRVKLLFENPDGKIRPGVAGRVILEEGARVN